MIGDIIFGPVASRRLGVSLGVDIVPSNVCSFDCVYCELGRTTKKTAERREYIPSTEVDEALDEFFLEGSPYLDYVTFSGSGEPTLHSDISHFIRKVKSLTDTPVAVITNGSLLPDPQVRADLAGADLIIPSLDAATQYVFSRINRPVHGIKVEDVIEGIRLLVEEHPSEVWLEILMVQGLNDTASEIEALADAAKRIAPARIQIGTVVRPPAQGDAYPVDEADLERIAASFQGRVEIIPAFRSIGERDHSTRQAERIVAMLKIRPETLDELCCSLGMHRREILKYIDALREEHAIKEVTFEGKRYYKID